LNIKIPKPELIPIERLKRNPKNIKTHPKEQIHDLMELMKISGFKDPIVIDKEYNIWAGHGRLDAAQKLKLEEVPCIFLEGLDDQQKKTFMLMDNKVNETNWIDENVQLVFDDIDPIHFEKFEMKFDKINKYEDFSKIEIQEVDIPENPTKKVKLGELWQLGNHRLMCGDATLPDHKDALLQGAELDIILTDPPYSSGGFQEAGKHQGSIGTQRIDEKTGKEYQPKIKMDDLSTRGYIKLIRSALFGLFTHNLYIFTDWRMWDWTRESIESSGYQVRAMIVWDKLLPGLGIQWRGQHELICFGRAKETVTPAWFRGNVINAKRSGNKHHPTEKPIEVLSILIKTNLRTETIYDPFAGSGSTLIAVEQLGKKCYCMELDPDFCDVIIQRWENFTGKKAIKVRNELKEIIP